MNKKIRLETLARKIALILRKDIVDHGEMKPSYMSPKFWVYVQREMQKFDDAKKASIPSDESGA